MQKIEILESDLTLLRKERFSHPPPRVMLKMEVVLLKGLGYSNSSICTIADVCDNTVRKYIRQYVEGGIERLKAVNFNRPISELSDYSGSIEKYFTDNPPRSISEACAKIESLTGIKRKETQVRKFLKSLNFRFVKSGALPAKALTEEKKTNNASFWQTNSSLD
jgi:transposase